MYTTKEGKTLNESILSTKRLNRMGDNGYYYRTIENETSQQAYDRLSPMYETVRIYTETTRIRGYHKLYALVRGLKIK